MAVCPALAAAGEAAKPRPPKRRRREPPPQPSAPSAAAAEPPTRPRPEAELRADPSLRHIADPLGAPAVREARRFFGSILGGRLLVRLGPLEGWRTEAKLAVRTDEAGRRPVIGLFAPGTHIVCPMSHCPAHHPAINQTLCLVRRACRASNVRGFDERLGTGDLRYLKLEVQRSTGQVQLTLVWHAATASRAGAPLRQLVRRLARNPLFYSIWANFHPAGPHVSRILAFEGTAWRRLAGRRRLLRERLAQCPVPYEAPRLCFPPYVFRQANLDAFGEIVGSLRHFVAPGSRVVELYAGVGTIGLHLADLVSSLVCSDENPHNQRCFRRSARDLPEHLQRRLDYKQGDAASQVGSLAAADVLVVDPPRKGLDEAVASALARPLEGGGSLRLLLYVSCGLRALQRDAGRLLAAGWTVTHAEGFVLFPGADHIETFCVFER